MSTVNFKSVEELRAMSDQQLRGRLQDVSVTLAAMRKGKKRGRSNPRIFHQIKQEKKLIIKIQNERGLSKNEI